MLWVDLIKSFLIGIIQGITEWLPVSSTAHMLLFNECFPLSYENEFSETFFTLIQLASILAVIVIYFDRLCPFSKKESKQDRRQKLRLWGNVLLGSIPVAAVGFIFDPIIEKLFYSDTGNVSRTGNFVIAASLIFYGVLFIALERKWESKNVCVTPKRAFCIGLFQSLAIVPGTSRSGSTILGARTLGVSRQESAEFSFFLAIPAMLGAGAHKILKLFLSGITLSFEEGLVLLVGGVSAFAVSMTVIEFLTGFLKKHTFVPFGVYRIILGAVILIILIFR